jgi:hypothetical protein
VNFAFMVTTRRMRPGLLHRRRRARPKGRGP